MERVARIAVNGFGRIGRLVLRAIRERYWEELEIVAIGVTDPYITETRAILLKHDSVHGPFAAEVSAVTSPGRNALRVDGREIDVVGRNRYGPVPEWQRWRVDLVLEATGFFKDRRAASQHLVAGAGRGCLRLGALPPRWKVTTPTPDGPGTSPGPSAARASRGAASSRRRPGAAG